MIAILVALAMTGTPARAPQIAPVTTARRDVGGWIYLRLSGTPREIGTQYGTLAHAEIADAHRVLRRYLKDGTQKDWTWFRDEAKKLFWEKLDAEYQEELTGQAEALTAKGHAIDVWDVLAFNAYIELEGYYLPWLNGEASTKESCSAFIATGSATKDGKIVIGHNLWWDYAIGSRFNVVLDITPKKGNRIVMDALAGFMHSGSDFAINAAGLVICETTLPNFFGFDPKGLPEFMRMRKATQYANTLDEWVAIMREGNNGGYANTWLIGDTKTQEIAKLELGLKNITEVRTKDGAYVGANFCENPKLIAEETRGYSENLKLNGSLRRKKRWESLLAKNSGNVTADKAREFLSDTYDEVLDKRGASGSTLCGRSAFGGAVNTKVTTSEMAKSFGFFGRMGQSDGTPVPRARNAPDYFPAIPSYPWVNFPAGTTLAN
ncbi:MAG: C45 family peptidase [Fimbriimonadaceae bacterium]|nr:C45 family peptidase [Fimbriimonadaceae bacterium]